MCYQNIPFINDGLNAIAQAHRQMIRTDDIDRHYSGDIDEYYRPVEPNSNRWDYVIICERNPCVKSYYIEVHPARSSEVSLVIRKLAWIKNKIHFDQLFTSLRQIKSEFYWIYPGKYTIPPASRYFKQCALNGLIPRRNIVVDHMINYR